MVELRPYQLEASQWLAANGHRYLAYDAGLGKTCITLAAAWIVDAKRIVVVCPASGMGVWRSEIAAWGQYTRGRDFTILSYDQLIRRHGAIVGGGPYDLLVCDEAHYLKSPETARTRAVLGKNGLFKHATSTWCLSGTPNPNNYLELWPPLYKLCDEFAHVKYQAFRDRYTIWREHPQYGVIVTRSINATDLHNKTAEFMKKGYKKDFLPQLPPVTWTTLPIDISQNSELTQALADLEAGFAEGQTDVNLVAQRRLVGLAKTPVVANVVQNELHGATGKVIIFAYFLDVIDQLRALLSAFNPAVVTGAVSPVKRYQEAKRFQEDPDCRVFIGQIQAAGEALTLTASSNVIFVESTWTPGQMVQAAARAHRFGQTRGVLVRIATMAGTIDDVIGRTLARKAADLDALEKEQDRANNLKRIA
jgi:SWI/SNF-related matrix-associated actin-dependent regulator 1 of chromatin subfamily A